MIGYQVHVKNGLRHDWLSGLLCSKFFSSCRIHQELRKNEENVFCIDCNVGFCKHCIKSHRSHRQLQICKYVYHDVVRLQDIQKHFDCTSIQTYKINGEKAVHLNPRPQSKDSKPSTKAKFGTSCEACRRYLQDPPNHFCSIACKLLAPSMKTIHRETISSYSMQDKFGEDQRQSSENESTLSLTDMSEETQDWRTRQLLKPRRVLRKRKGVPRRAPLS